MSITRGNNSEAHTRRGRALKLAAITSVGSKLGSVILQLIAVPVAIGVLGKEQYGIYATVLVFYAFLQLAECGLLGSLSRRITMAAASGDRNAEHSILYSGVIMIGALGCIGIAVMALVLSNVPLTTILGDGYAGYESEIYRAVAVAAVVSILYLVTYCFAAARYAYQEAHYYNLWGTLGNVMGGVLLITGIHIFPTVPYVILCVLGTPVITQTLNAIHLMKQRAYLRFSLKKMRIEHMKTLWKEGLSLQIAENVTILVHQEGGKIILAHLFGPVAVGLFAALMQIRVFLTNVVLVFTMPLWPSITEAKEGGDLAWIRLSRKRACLFVVGYVVSAAVGLITLGPYAADIWLRGEIAISHIQFAAFALYFGFLMWVHVQFILLTGCGSIHIPAVLMIGEALLAIGLAIVGAHAGGVAGIFLGLTLAMITVSAWAFPVLISRKMRAMENDFAPPSEGVEHSEPVLVSS